MPVPTPTPTPTPPPANRAPVFTSPATASVPENTAGTIYSATATDADGNTLTFSLAGGTDQAVFRITAGGALSFAAPPDFEAPADADRNNVYLVRIGVSDGMTSTTLDLAVTVTNAGADAFRVSRVGTGFVEPIFVAPAPSSSSGSFDPSRPIRIFVVERGGRIYLFTPSTGERTIYLDLSSIVSTEGERGLLGFAISPNYSNDAAAYVYLTNRDGDIELRRYRSGIGDRDFARFSTGNALLTIEHSSASNHNGGWIGFGPDNLLYLAVGDGGGAGDPPNNAQNTNSLLGKILRIAVVGTSDIDEPDAFPADADRDYAIPASNPFAMSGGRPEVWAFGLRNPFRASFDAPSQTFWIGDVGQNAREEIDLMRPQDGGANFGWRVLEGTSVFNGVPTASMVPPIAQYEHGSGPRQGNSVTGGYVYRGPVEALQGNYFFGDFVTGNIWSIRTAAVSLGMTIPSSEFVLRRTEFTPDQGAIGNIASFGVDLGGNLYIVDFDGEIFRVEAQP